MCTPFWLGPKSSDSSGSNRAIWVSRSSIHSQTKLKRAATALAFPDVHAQHDFNGSVNELDAIVDAEIAGFSRKSKLKK